MLLDRKLSIGSLIAVFLRKICLTLGLTLLETAMLAALPLLIGLSIDGLLAGNETPFLWLISTLGLLLAIGLGRRVYDTRAYGSIRVALGEAVVEKAKRCSISTVSARLDMSRELARFLEEEVPLVLGAVVQLAVAIVVLYSYHGVLAACAGSAAILALMIYAIFGSRFFAHNAGLNEQTEKQVTVLQSGGGAALRVHLSALRQHEVHLSDIEALVYGLIFAVLLGMLGFNLWFAATQAKALPGQIFSIVAYSYEFIESAVLLPTALQSLTRISEITQRLNPPFAAAE